MQVPKRKFMNFLCKNFISFEKPTIDHDVNGDYSVHQHVYNSCSNNDYKAFDYDKQLQ